MSFPRTLWNSRLSGRGVTGMRDEGRSGIDRRLDKDRRSGVDARSAEERQLDGERRSGQERRAGLERRGAQLSPAEDAVSKVLSSSSIDEKIDFLVRSSAQVGSALAEIERRLRCVQQNTRQHLL